VVILVILVYALCSAIQPLFVGLASLTAMDFEPAIQNEWSNTILQRKPFVYIRKVNQVYPPTTTITETKVEVYPPTTTITQTKVETALEVEVERSAVAHAAPKDRVVHTDGGTVPFPRHPPNTCVIK
jgi:hypothetical protein